MPTQFNHRIANIERGARLPTADAFIGLRFAYRSFDYSHRPVIDVKKYAASLSIS
jgi:hypothetical protein